MNPSLRPALGSLAALAALSLTPSTKAQVTMSSISNLTVQNGDLAALDIDGDGTTDFYLNNITQFFTPADTGDSLFSNAGLGSSPREFSFGESITGVADATGPVPLNDVLGDLAYFGLSFQHDGSTHNAWIQVDMTSVTGAFIVDSAAWEATADTAIAAGATAVPEPATTAASLGLLAGLAAWLRRRRRA